MLPLVRVAAYARKSPGEHRHRDYPSTRAQLDMIQRWCETVSETSGAPHRVVREFVDERKSGKNLDRPDVRALMSFVAEGGCHKVVVYRLDRITRSTNDFGRLDDCFTAQGVDLVSLKENLDTSTPMGRAMRTVILAFAQLERETTVERVKDKHRAMQERGLWTGGATPYGYKRIGKGKLEVDPERARILVEIMTWFADDGMSVLSIRHRLNADRDRYPVPATHPEWRHQTISRMLRHPCHRGRYRFGRQDLPWPFPVIPPADLVARVDERLLSHTRRRGPNQLSYAFQRIARCGRCGYLMRKSAVYSRQSEFVYLRCSATSQNSLDGSVPRCHGPNIRMDFFDQVETAVLECVRAAQPRLRPWDPPPDTSAEISGLEEQKRRLLVAYTQAGSPMTDEEYEAGIRACDERIEALQPAPPRLDPVDILTLADTWDGLPIGQRHSALRLLVDAAVVHPDRVDVWFAPTDWDGLPDGIRVHRPGSDWETITREEAFCE